jgi:hypothetical protein
VFHSFFLSAPGNGGIVALFHQLGQRIEPWRSHPASRQGEGRLVLRCDHGRQGFALRDNYHSAATLDLCSLELDKSFTHGAKKADEKITFDQQNHTATRQTQNGGGKTDVSISACAKDALTFMQFARNELAQGRLAPQQAVVFGAQYDVRIEYTGAQRVKVSDQMSDADRILATIKGPTTNITVEIFFARDAARTPLLARIPLSLGSFTVELIR